MSSRPRFTVVLSGYDTAPFLPKAISSIAEQSFKDFEAILYIEESNDNSLEIAQAAAERDNRFIAVSRPKSGACATTRNYGIDNARGEYLVVIDGDDWLLPGMFEALDKKISGLGEVDVLAFKALSVRSEDENLAKAKEFSNFTARDADSTFTGADAIRSTANRGGQFHNFTWLSAYRTDFLREEKLYQSDGRLMEDAGWTPRVWFAAKKIAYIDRPFYIYRRRSNSITTEASPRIVHDLAFQVRALAQFAETPGIPNDIKRIWANQWLAVMYWFLFHPVSSRKVPDKDRVEAIEYLCEGEGLARLKAMAALSSRPRRMAFPLLMLARRGVTFPAKFFFRKLYYPLCG